MNETNEIILSPDQTEALRLIHLFLDDEKRSEFKLGGFAGTGKTTLIRKLLDDLSADRKAKQRAMMDNEEYSTEDEYDLPTHDVAIISFTGKAVSVLRKKGLEASTIHSSIYTPVKGKDGEISWVRKAFLENDFVSDPSLIIVDEASMISLSLYKDLVSYGKKILWVGDPGQLEPIGDNPDLMRSPDYILTQIHRQALENPILKFSVDVRNGIPFLNGMIGKENELQCILSSAVRTNPKLLTDPDIIIVGFNKERKALNRRIRELKRFSGPLNVGEKIIVLQNCAAQSVFNGQIVTVLHLGEIHETVIHYKKYECQWIRIEDELGNQRVLEIWRRPLSAKDYDESKEECPRGLVLIDYGYVITCHKSQGSEWDSVLVFEPGWWPSKPVFTWDQKRWRYTAITRASKRLVYARS